MKKSLLALATMGAFAGAAQAQSSVSVYGIYDGGYSATKTDMTSAAGVKTGSQAGGFSGGESASSRIGFRGVEDLGGGLSANFNLELGITSGTGQVQTTTAAPASCAAGAACAAGVATGANQGSETGVRTGIVGIGSKQFGSLAVGRQLTGMHSILAGDVWGGNNMAGDITYSDVSSTAAGAGVTATNRINSVTTRSSNMLTYTSPTVMGANLRADYGNTTSTATSQPGIQYAIKGIYAGYKYGPVTAKIGRVEAVSNEALAVAAVYSGTKTVVTGGNIMYQDKGLTVQYTNGRNLTETYTVAAGYIQGSAVKANKISASYQIGAVMPFVQYGQGVSEGVRTGANTATDDKAFQIGSEYALSKRSSLYAAYGSHKKSLKTNGSATTDITDMAVGLRHTF
jgi:predicted porin